MNRAAAMSDLSFALPCPDISAWRAGNTGIEGVWQFDSGVPGRHVMVSALVHGNELCGAWALRGLLEAGMHMLSTKKLTPSSGETNARSGFSSIMVRASPA